MDKDKFMFLLSNNASLTEAETNELLLLKDKFPYSQAIHNLVARGTQLNDFSSKQAMLTQAAVYATDRAVLKTLITALSSERSAVFEEKSILTEPGSGKKVEIPLSDKPSPTKDPAKTKLIKEKAEQKEIEEIAPKMVFKASNLGGDELIDELFQDLDRLKKLKHDFEIAADQFNKLPSTPPMAPLAEPAAKEKHEVTKERKEKKTKGIIAEIKSTKKKIISSDPKQKEQLDIINQFIKSEPNIGKNKGVTTPTDTTDLTESSGVFTDNIVSETLVEILIKQGKKEKAVEVLRKLIWKFPQKKAYFAAQIDELNNN